MFNRVFLIDTFPLARLTPKSTGVSCNIWLDSLGCERRCSKQPYILIRRRFGWEKIYLNKISKANSHELQTWVEINKYI